jgi:hypothetical protein
MNANLFVERGVALEPFLVIFGFPLGEPSTEGFAL